MGKYNEYLDENYITMVGEATFNTYMQLIPSLDSESFHTTDTQENLPDDITNMEQPFTLPSVLEVIFSNHTYV